MTRGETVPHGRKMLCLLMVCIAAFILASSRGHAADVPRISKEALKSQLDNPEFVIIDVRTAGDWKSSEWKILGAVREDPGAVESWQKKYDRNKTIVLYCA